MVSLTGVEPLDGVRAKERIFYPTAKARRYVHLSC